MRISDWSSDVCSSDLGICAAAQNRVAALAEASHPSALMPSLRAGAFVGLGALGATSASHYSDRAGNGLEFLVQAADSALVETVSGLDGVQDAAGGYWDVIAEEISKRRAVLNASGEARPEGRSEEHTSELPS